MQSPEEPHRKGEVTPAAGRGGPASPLLPVVEAGGAFVATQGLGGGGGAVWKEPGRREPHCAGLAVGLTSSTSDCCITGCSSLRLHSLKGNSPPFSRELRRGVLPSLFIWGSPGLSAPPLPPTPGTQPWRATCASCLPGALGFTRHAFSHPFIHSLTMCFSIKPPPGMRNTMNRQGPYLESLTGGKRDKQRTRVLLVPFIGNKYKGSGAPERGFEPAECGSQDGRSWQK